MSMAQQLKMTITFEIRLNNTIPYSFMTTITRAIQISIRAIKVNLVFLLKFQPILDLYYALKINPIFMAERVNWVSTASTINILKKKIYIFYHFQFNINVPN